MTLDDTTRDDARPQTMTEVIEELHDAAQEDETSLGHLLSEVEHASFTPVLLAPALAVVTPLSGIPLFSSLCGLCIALVSAQMLFGRESLWLPQWLQRRKIPSDKLKSAVKTLRKPARWLDRHSRERLRVLVRPPFDRITHLLCLLCGLAMPMLELVPFSSSILGAAVSLMAMTLLLRDGLFALTGYAFILGVIGLAIYLI
ncbi:exopolysaccharide biosynthesis protein [Ponticoccus alexandrii]|nr:exopolysaccharide biosynthesis protein [Ponticoccus alexandrii]